MSNVYDLKRRERLLDEASEWISRLDRGLSSDEERELQKFLQSPNARAQLLELAQHWDKLDSLSRLADLMPPAEHTRARPRLVWAIAASVLIVGVLGLALVRGIDGPGGGSTPPATSVAYETAIGESAALELADSSAVQLNTDTEILVTFTPTDRVILLRRGEAHFDVESDPDRPFSVMVEERVVQVIGTEFSIQITDTKQIELIVVEGAVSVSTRQSILGVGASNQAPQASVDTKTLTAGSIALLGSDSEVISEISEEAIDTKLSWRTGSLIFDGESLEAALTEIGRYTEVEFVFLDEDIRSIPVGGLFRAGDVDGLLRSLQTNFGIAYQRTDDDRVLLSKQ